MIEWKEIIITRKSSFAVGLARSICSINCIQQRIERSQQAVGQISSQALLHSEKPIAKQAVSQFETKIGQHVVAQLVQIPWIQNITKNLPYDFGSSLPGIDEIEAELRDLLLCSNLKNHREHRVHREKLHRSVLSVYSVVENLGSNSLFQEKLKSLGIEWR